MTDRFQKILELHKSDDVGIISESMSSAVILAKLVLQAEEALKKWQENYPARRGESMYPEHPKVQTDVALTAIDEFRRGK